MEYEFNDIPVEIDGEVHAFNYGIWKTDKYGQACHITSEGKELVVDENLREPGSTLPVCLADFPIPAGIDQ